MKPNSIIVIQVSSMAGMESRDFFDEYDLVRDKDYLLWRTFHKETLADITPNEPQLVFTSHVDGSIDSRQVAAEIKEKNPVALVFALTWSKVPNERGDLDGVIHKGTEPRNFTARLSKLFLKGVSKQQLIRAVKEFEHPV